MYFEVIRIWNYAISFVKVILVPLPNYSEDALTQFSFIKFDVQKLSHSLPLPQTNLLPRFYTTLAIPRKKVSLIFFPWNTKPHYCHVQQETVIFSNQVNNGMYHERILAYFFKIEFLMYKI